MDDGSGDTEDVDRRVDELYDMPPAEFTAARNTLVKALRADGRRDDAGRVGKLRRPSVAAWAVNQTVRRHRDRVDALLEAGQQVRRAQRRAMSGVRQSGLRDATRSRRDLIDELTNLALAILTEDGANTDAHRGDIATTFDAASADDDAAADVSAARLAAPLPVASGFDSLDGLALLTVEEPAADDTEDDKDSADTDDTTDTDDAERERVAQRRRDAIRAAEDARREVAQAQGHAQRSGKKAQQRADAAEKAARTAQEAEQTWRRLQRKADELAEQVTRMHDEAQEAQRSVERAQAQLQERERDLNDLEGGASH